MYYYHYRSKQNKERKKPKLFTYSITFTQRFLSSFYSFFLLTFITLSSFIFLELFLVVCLLYYAVGIGSLSISFISLDLLDFLITVLLIVLALFMGSPLTTFSISSLVKVSYSNKPSANRFNSSLLSYNNFLVLFHYPTNNL